MFIWYWRKKRKNR